MAKAKKEKALGRDPLGWIMDTTREGGQEEGRPAEADESEAEGAVTRQPAPPPPSPAAPPPPPALPFAPADEHEEPADEPEIADEPEPDAEPEEEPKAEPEREEKTRLFETPAEPPQEPPAEDEESGSDEPEPDAEPEEEPEAEPKQEERTRLYETPAEPPAEDEEFGGDEPEPDAEPETDPEAESGREEKTRLYETSDEPEPQTPPAYTEPSPEEPLPRRWLDEAAQATGEDLEVMESDIAEEESRGELPAPPPMDAGAALRPVGASGRPLAPGAGHGREHVDIFAEKEPTTEPAAKEPEPQPQGWTPLHKLVLFLFAWALMLGVLAYLRLDKQNADLFDAVVQHKQQIGDLQEKVQQLEGKLDQR